MSPEVVDPFPFEFVRREPSGSLGRAVESLWHARGTVPYEREHIAPTGSAVVVIVLGDPISQTPLTAGGLSVTSETGLIIGPHVGPVINEPNGETYAVGIVATAVGCEALFGILPSTISGMVFIARSVWAPALLLRRRLLDEVDPEVMLDIVETSLRATLNFDITGLDRCERAVALLKAKPTRPIADIANELEVSHSHLDAEFRRLVGMSPRSLARLLRLRSLLLDLDIHSDISWVELAAEFGWFDQAHLIRDFRRHTGVTPTAYVRAQKADLSSVSPTDAAGFVPRM